MEKFKLQDSYEKPVEIKDLREFDIQYLKSLKVMMPGFLLDRRIV